MLEQSLINPNFAGRDGFKWFIGVTANTQPDRADLEYGYRVQVRIIGHHPGDTMKDADLPWAHVLVPTNMGSGAGGAGISMNTRGGEVVIGFFADGEDAQQPVIIGALYNGANIDYLNTFTQGTQNFKLFQQKSGAIVSPYNKTVKNGESSQGRPGIPKPDGDHNKEKTVARDVLNKNPVIGIPGHCREGKDVVSQINRGLIKFIQLMNEVKYINDTYVQPVLNKVVNIDEEIDEIATVISDALIWLVKYIRDEIIAGIYNLLKDYLEGIELPKELEFLKKAAAGEIADGIWCLFLNILKKIKKFVFDFLFGMIGKVSSIPICLVETFTGSILQSAVNEITDAIGPALDQVQSLLGGGIGTVMSYVDKAINIAKTVASFLQCEESPCKQVFDYEMNKGFVPKDGDIKFQNIINYSPSQGLRNLLDDGKKQAEGFLGGISGGDGLPDEISQYFGGTCDYNLNCGMPEVKIFGGGGSGASGNAVVDAFGQIMGVNITNPGEGYTSEPFVSFDDSCENGTGAVGYVKIKDGRVWQTVMINTGSGYLGPDTSNVNEDVDDETLNEVACSISPAESSGSIVYPYISDIIIESTGLNYSEGDKAVNLSCNGSDVEIDLELDANGRIIGTKITNPGTSINIYPELTINSDTGSGAILKPVLGFNTTPPEIIQTDQTKVKTVVYCSDKK
jgi:hypothetical protein